MIQVDAAIMFLECDFKELTLVGVLFLDFLKMLA